ncbi:MAG: histidinol dehydrogenase, partial [Acidobacteria bacterium]|nr:histidinol dehydrogenase [Acidobacteriota bacterium]
TGVAGSTPVRFLPPPASLITLRGDEDTAAVGQLIPLEVQALGSDGLGVEGVAISFQAPSGATVTDAVVITDTFGTAGTTGTLGTTAGTYPFEANVAGLAPTALRVVAVAGPGTALAFTVQPTTTTTASVISPAVEVTIHDAFGNIATGTSATITLSFSGSPNGADLLGTTSIAAVEGTASVADLRIEQPGFGYRLAAGADGLLAVGGAQAIAALAFGSLSPPCDVVVGPGNRWVTAAKKHLVGEVGIDGLAGPSEIVIVADRAADPRLVAADLLAQAEHDPEALPILVTDDPQLIPKVEDVLNQELASLSTAPVASAALERGYSIVVADFDQAVEVCDAIAPEHLALHIQEPDAIADRFSAYGSLFMGQASAEVLADYGAGPNHVLPTGGGARFQSGLAVTTFLRSPTWMTISEPRVIAAGAAGLARWEGLEAHARAAAERRQ